MSYFNVRVYGLLINDKNEILVSDELERGRYFSKFPGGGVELGEGLIDALKREFLEECFIQIKVDSHFYTTDFYEKSKFNDSQIISVYYLVTPLEELKLNFKSNPFDFDDKSLDLNQCFRWRPLSAINEEDVSFKTDKTVVKLLKNKT